METLSKADQQYRNRLRRKNLWYGAGIVFVVLCTLFLYVGTNWLEIKVSSHTVDFLTGMFSSLSVILILYIVKNRRVMNNPKLLRKQRIVMTDERNQEIINRAYRLGAHTLIICIIVLSVVGSFVHPLMTQLAVGLLFLFFAAYLIGYLYYRKKS
ncbi:DUF6442 family protein [Enterococcus pallens]|uniref:DUF2178 domain-containing protein n=1 Tax=Enterococcus pallens ATCC BAA-351 TaxID=1158607 RepID=R2STT4_9ENTE|nr:DUF6442 family protein [Enterococcus pallens]EOH96236.1 hypothetical protein UAU_00885 [Enterococcus pallens ATCC BAA-351]EOU14551.1 hypothetical protein I588_04909 [Enterococcus pallens ATCC BAA-351]OJG80957.1 hypothetical protein RV10_GL003956 [Enterococcus pallens]